MILFLDSYQSKVTEVGRERKWVGHSRGLWHPLLLGNESATGFERVRLHCAERILLTLKINLKHFLKLSRFFNSYAWGVSVSGHLTLKGVFVNF